MDDWYGWWVAVYVKATGSGPEVAGVLVENREVFLERWAATREELEECSDRLVVNGRVPRWPNEHTNALHGELVRLREERAGASRPFAPGDFPPADCPACGGYGYATVPHKHCMDRGEYVPAKLSGRRMTQAVVCDCPAGRAARDGSGLPTLSRVNAYHRCDMVAVLRAWERKQAAEARGPDNPRPPTLNMDAVLAGVGMTVPAKRAAA